MATATGRPAATEFPSNANTERSMVSHDTRESAGDMDGDRPPTVGEPSVDSTAVGGVVCKRGTHLIPDDHALSHT